MVKQTKDPYEEKRAKIQRSCVLVYKPDKCYNGYTLFSTYKSNTFYLIDMEGNVIHTWTVKTAKIAEILPNGHLMYGNQWKGMVETDFESKELWYYPCTQHHDFAVMENGHIMVLCGIQARGSPQRPVWEKRFNPKIYEVSLFGTAYFIEVDPRRNERVWEWWADEHVEELKKVGVKLPTPLFDVFHSNTCEVLPETELGKEDPKFKAGNVVFSHRNLDVIGVIDKRDGEVVWAWGPGTLDRQHMPTLIPDRHPITGEPLPGAGRFLIFDNGTHRGYSRVLEVDPKTERIVWEYKAPGFFGDWSGGQDRMPNGNTVISEGGIRGRLFEITPEGEIVWEYLTPYFDGTGRHDIYRCVRYPPEYIEPMLKASEKPLL